MKDATIPLNKDNVTDRHTERGGFRIQIAPKNVLKIWRPGEQITGQSV